MESDNQLLQTSHMFLCCQYVVKSFRELFLILSSSISKRSLRCPNESGFDPFDSRENQLQSIVHNIYANFDQDPTLEVRAIFLDTPEAYGVLVFQKIF